MAEIINSRGIGTGQLICTAAGVGYQLPDRAIPHDKELLVKAWPTNIGTIFVGRSKTEAQNAIVGWPLIGNEGVSFKVRNAKAIWVSATVAGERVAWAVEQD